MIRVLVACLLCVVSTVARADGPPSWTGFYVGAHGGWLTGGWDGNLIFDPDGTRPFEPFQQAPTPLWGDSTARSLDGNAWLGGFQLGFNVQTGAMVWGIEGDVSWTNLEEEGAFRTFNKNGTPGDVVWNIRNRLDVFGTVRGRLGLSTGPGLIYATGGLAWAQATSSLVVNQPFPANNNVTGIGSAEETHVGWTGGIGLEWALTRNLSIKGEYLYVDLGSADYHLVGTNFITNPDSVHKTDSFPADLTFQTVRIGVNYKFGAND